MGLSTPETQTALKAIPNLELRVIPFHRLTGGIVHAKYLLVDGEQAFEVRRRETVAELFAGESLLPQ